MNGWFNPDDALDLISQALLVIGGLAIAVIPSWFAAKANSTAQKLDRSISNGHTGPLRADIDRVLESIDRLSHDVSAIRRDLADEETRRRSHVAELREELHRKVDDLHRRFGANK